MKRKVISLILIAAWLLPASSRPAYAHKFHVSFAEADYNREEQSLQISLRTFPDDLENILTRRAGRRVTLDRKREAETLAFDYLREVFQLRDAKGQPIKLSWVGMEASVDTVWLYFEAKAITSLKGIELSNRFLQDLFDDQLNKTSIRQGTRRMALTFRRGDGFKPVEVK